MKSYTASVASRLLYAGSSHCHEHVTKQRLVQQYRSTFNTMGEFKFCVGVDSVNWAVDSSPNIEFGSIKLIPITLLIAPKLNT